MTIACAVVIFAHGFLDSPLAKTHRPIGAAFPVPKSLNVQLSTIPAHQATES